MLQAARCRRTHSRHAPRPNVPSSICVALRQCGSQGRREPADEVAVGEFIAGRIAFPAIAALVEATLDAAAGRGLLAEPTGIDAALAVDHIARSLARDLLPEIAVKAS